MAAPDWKKKSHQYRRGYPAKYDRQVKKYKTLVVAGYCKQKWPKLPAVICV